MQNFFSWEKDGAPEMPLYMPTAKAHVLASPGLMGESKSNREGILATPDPQMPGSPQMPPPPETGGGIKKPKKKEETPSQDYEMQEPDFSNVPNYTGADPWDPAHYEGMYVDPNDPIGTNIGSGLGELVNPVFDPSNYEGLLNEGLLGGGGISDLNPVFDSGAYEGTFYNPDDPFGMLGAGETGGLMDTLNGAWQKISDYIPLIGLGMSVYNMTQNGVTPGSALALGTAAVGAAAAAAGASMGPWGLLPAVAIMGGQAMANKPSREYYDPNYGMDLGDGRYLMLGNQVSKDKRVGYDDLQAGDNYWQNASGKDRAWDIIYDSNTNSFSRLDPYSLYDEISTGALNPEGYARQEYDRIQENNQMLDYFPEMGMSDYNDITYEQLLEQMQNSSVYQPTEDDELLAMAGMGGYEAPIPEYQQRAGSKAMYDAGLLTEDSIRQHALDALENNQFTDLQYAEFKGAPAVGNYSKKYPMMLSSLQAAYQQMANQYGWGLPTTETAGG